MENIEELTLGQIAAEDPRTCSVFEKYKVDYYNNGKRNFREVADEQNLDIATLKNEIEKVSEGSVENDSDFNSWDLAVLADYIVETHHKYAEKQIQIIKHELEKVCQALSAQFPELEEVKKLFNTVAGEIVVHQKKEELILFPYIKKMADALRNNKPFVRPPMTKSAEKPVDMLTHEHTKQGEDFKKIAELTKDHTLQFNNDASLSGLMNFFKEFESNLHRHIHLENNILFPKALRPDRELKA